MKECVIVLKKQLLFILLSFISISTVFSQQSSLQNFLQTVIKNTIIVQDFDEEEQGVKNIDWQVRASTYITKTNEKPYPQKSFVIGAPNTLPASLYKEDRSTMRLLALRAAFNQKGYNFLNIIPYETSETPRETDGDGERLPGIYFEEPILDFGLYVWGSNRDYNLEANFETNQGVQFTVSLGSLNFYGWKTLRVELPIKYYREFARNTANPTPGATYAVKLTKLVLRTNPTERVDDFIVYFDGLFATESFGQIYYNGVELAEQGNIENIDWEKPDDTESDNSEQDSADTPVQ